MSGRFETTENNKIRILLHVKFFILWKLHNDKKKVQSSNFSRNYCLIYFGAIDIESAFEYQKFNYIITLHC